MPRLLVLPVFFIWDSHLSPSRNWERVNYCINVRWVFSKCVGDIENLGLQKLVVTTIMGFFGVLSPSFTLMLIMVVIIPIVVEVKK